MVPLLWNVSQLLAIVSTHFIGVNIDSASLYQYTPPHRLNISDSTLLHLASQLAPGTTLRIGGSSAEDLGWGPGTGQVIEVDLGYWDEIMEFAAKAKLSVSWDLNAARMRHLDSHGSNLWNSSNAEALLQYVASRPEQRRVLGAVQLGNEPGHYLDNCDPHVVGDCVSPEEHGRDFLKLRELLVEVMGEEKPVLQGPDGVYLFH